MLDCVIVENHEDTREAETEYLAWRGFSVRAADGGDRLWALVRERVPDVIVMDLQLPGVDGWELTRQLRADDRTKHVPIAVVSAAVTEADRGRAEASGADAFLPKPCDPDEIVATLTRLAAVSQRQAPRETGARG